MGTTSKAAPTAGPEEIEVGDQLRNFSGGGGPRRAAAVAVAEAEG